MSGYFARLATQLNAAPTVRAPQAGPAASIDGHVVVPAPAGGSAPSEVAAPAALPDATTPLAEFQRRPEAAAAALPPGAAARPTASLADRSPALTPRPGSATRAIDATPDVRDGRGAVAAPRIQLDPAASAGKTAAPHRLPLSPPDLAPASGRPIVEPPRGPAAAVAAPALPIATAGDGDPAPGGATAIEAVAAPAIERAGPAVQARAALAPLLPPVPARHPAGAPPAAREVGAADRSEIRIGTVAVEVRLPAAPAPRPVAPPAAAPAPAPARFSPQRHYLRWG